jgi:hypothetical protein
VEFHILRILVPGLGFCLEQPVFIWIHYGPFKKKNSFLRNSEAHQKTESKINMTCTVSKNSLPSKRKGKSHVSTKNKLHRLLALIDFSETEKAAKLFGENFYKH